MPTFAELKEISELTSTCYRTSNRAWLALMTVAAVVLVPRGGTEKVDLPFDLGSVSSSAFYAIALTMLVAVTIAFAAAHAQAFRAQKLAVAALAGLSADAKAEPTRLHPRDVFDALQQPTINRVGPLAQLIRGRYQFFPEAAKAPNWLRWLVNLYYFILKGVAFAFYFLVPSAALIQAFRAVNIVGGWKWLAWIGVVVAGGALLEVMWMELVHIARVIKTDLGTKPKPPDGAT